MKQLYVNDSLIMRIYNKIGEENGYLLSFFMDTNIPKEYANIISKATLLGFQGPNWFTVDCELYSNRSLTDRVPIYVYFNPKEHILFGYSTIPNCKFILKNSKNDSLYHEISTNYRVILNLDGFSKKVDDTYTSIALCETTKDNKYYVYLKDSFLLGCTSHDILDTWIRNSFSNLYDNIPIEKKIEWVNLFRQKLGLPAVYSTSNYDVNSKLRKFVSNSSQRFFAEYVWPYIDKLIIEKSKEICNVDNRHTLIINKSDINKVFALQQYIEKELYAHIKQVTKGLTLEKYFVDVCPILFKEYLKQQQSKFEILPNL